MYIIFLFWLKTIDCGYALEPLRWGYPYENPQSMFGAKIRKIPLMQSVKIVQSVKIGMMQWNSAIKTT